MPILTTKYQLPYPVPADTPDVPRDIKALAEAVETALDVTIPTGAIIPYGGTTAPTGWALCNGQPHNSSKLATILGSPNTPNLQGRFLVGAGGTYAAGATGGLATVQLTAAESGSGAHTHSATLTPGSDTHTHTIAAFGVATYDGNVDHAHWVDPPAFTSAGGGGHSHGVIVREGSGDGDGGYVDTNPTTQSSNRGVGYTDGGGHEHTINVPGSWSGGFNTNHAHSVDIPSRTTGGPSMAPGGSISLGASAPGGASAAHENRPPYFAVTFIIKL